MNTCGCGAFDFALGGTVGDAAMGGGFGAVGFGTVLQVSDLFAILAIAAAAALAACVAPGRSQMASIGALGSGALGSGALLEEAPLEEALAAVPCIASASCCVMM